MDQDKDVWITSNGDYWKATWVGPDGRRQSKSVGAKAKLSKRQARVFGRRLAAEANGPDAKPGAPTLSAWLTTFADSRGVGTKTKGGYRECGYYLRCYFDDDPTLGEITRADAAAWRDAMAGGALTAKLNELARKDPAWVNKSTKVWRQPSASTVAKHVRAAKLLFQEAADRDLIPLNPFGRLKGAPPAVDKDWRDVTHADMAKVFEACPSAPWRLLFALCRFTGLRLGEAMRLHWSAIDWAGNRMLVNARLERATTKKRKRVVPIEPARCPSGLTLLLREAFETAPDGAGLVVPISANNLRRDALNILKRSGVGEYAKPFHTLRKCCETEWAAEYPQHVVSEWIGHDITVSARHYLRVPEELYAAPSARISRAQTPDSESAQAGGAG